MTNQSKPDIKPIVLWAVDPFAKDLSLQRSVTWLLKDLSGRAQFQIQPVYLTGPSRLGLDAEGRKAWLSELKSRAQEEVNELIRRMRFKAVLPLAVVESSGQSRSENVEALLAYARETRAQLIVASTRARKGPARWFLGSFAETLSLRSDIPLLMINPTWDRRSAFDRILFATDFSEISHKAFLQLLPQAKQLGSKIIVFNKLPAAGTPAFEMAYEPEMMAVLLDEDLKASKAEAKRWVEEAKSAGVQAEPLVISRPYIPLIKVITELTRKRPAIIAMAASSSPLEIAILGSFTRETLRGAECPVWILHPEKQEESAMNKPPRRANPQQDEKKESQYQWVSRIYGNERKSV